MRLNENTIICGDKVVLVPYRTEHVSTYHEWMKSEELLELTASESLTLEEEYGMQRKWHLDEDTLTFILLAKPSYLTQKFIPTPYRVLLTPSEVQQCRMIGDVNLFLPNGKEGEVECEIMIASPNDRRRGYAREALDLILSYIATILEIPRSQIIARIGTANAPSINLFQSLNFGIVKTVDVFNEVELRWGWDPDTQIQSNDRAVGVGGRRHVFNMRMGTYEEPGTSDQRAIHEEGGVT